MFRIFKAAWRRRRRTQTAQQELIVAFDGIGGKFMQLDPVIREALLIEAIATDGDWTTRNFMNLENAIQSSETYPTEENKAAALREIYRTRVAKFDVR